MRSWKAFGAIVFVLLTLIAFGPLRSVADEKQPVSPVLVFVTGDSCPACLRMKPVVERTAKRFPIRTLDWERDAEEVKRWNVRLLPTFIVLNRGKETGREVGVVSEERLERMCKGK